MSPKDNYPAITQILEQYYREAGSDYNTLSAQGIDPFYMAVRSFDEGATRFWFQILGEEFKRNHVYPDEQSIAYLAVQDSNLQMVQLLFSEMHFDINIVPKHGYSILGNATQNATEEVFDYLLNLPNVNFRIHDHNPPFSYPLEKSCKQQDISRVTKILMAMLKNNLYLNPNELKMLVHTIKDKNPLTTLLNQYSKDLKQHFKIQDLHFTVSPNYKAAQLLTYLDFWNVHSRIDDSFIPEVIDGNKKYSGQQAVRFMVDTLMPLIGFGMLTLPKLLNSYHTIKQIGQLYNLPKEELLSNLETEITQSLDKYRAALTSGRFDEFKAAEINELAHFMQQAKDFIKLHSQNPNHEIVHALQKLSKYLTEILTEKFSWITQQDLTSGLKTLSQAMQQVNAQENVQQFVSSFAKNTLPKATKTFILSASKDNPPEQLFSNSHNTFKKRTP